MASRLRMQRFKWFTAMLRGASPPVRILDVGGTPEFWIAHRSSLPVEADIVLLNLEFPEKPKLPGISYVTGDARQMSMFRDGEFDVCFSNSVIEHVGTLLDQLHMARDIRRVGRGYFVQTPNVYFPIEPHFLVCGWQFAPLAVRARLVQYCDTNWVDKQRDPVVARAIVESIRLLSEREMRGLFPDAKIHREKIGPLTKSLVACRGMR